MTTLLSSAQEDGSAHRPTNVAHVVSPTGADLMLSTRRRSEAVVRLCGAAVCLAAVSAAAVWVGGQGGSIMTQRAELLAGLSSDNYYVDARVAQHREERLQELNELQREAQEKRERKAQLLAQETRQAEDEDAMAEKQLDRYNDIYTASTPEEAALESQSPQTDSAADVKLDQRLDQYDAPSLTVARAYGRAGLTAYNGGVSPMSVAAAPIQNFAAATRSQDSVKSLVSAVSEDIESIRDELESSPGVQEQRGSTQLKDILDSSMLEIKGLAKRVGAHLRSAAPLRLAKPIQAASAQYSAPMPAASAVAAATPTLPRAEARAPAPAVVQQQAQVADDKRIGKERPYPSMQSMITKYKAWMAAKKEVEETALEPTTLQNIKTQGLTSVPYGKPALASAPGPCARINQAHAGDTAARENACANTAACHYDFGYQLCLQKK